MHLGGASIRLMVLLLLGLSPVSSAYGKTKLKKQKYSHRHSHSTKKDEHSHEHEHKHSPFTFTLGITYSASSGEGGGEGGHDESGHSHGLTGESNSYQLDGNDSHGGEGEESGEAGAEPLISSQLGYRITDNVSANLGVGYGFQSGVKDPSFGFGLKNKLNKKTSLNSSLSATAPVSEASRESYKITTVTLASGPSWQQGAWTLGAKAALSKSYYSKTIIVEEDEHSLRRSGLNLIEEDHEGEEHEIGDEGTGDREFDRYGLTSNLGYRLSKLWQIGCGLGAAYVTHQFGPATYETTATIVQGTLTWKSVAASAAFLTSAGGESLSAPTNPGFSVGVMYMYE